MNRSIAHILNILALYAISGVLIAAFAMQFALGELPCPLCMLQRVFFCAMAIGPVLNLRFGPRPSHYALSMLAAMAGAAGWDDASPARTLKRSGRAGAGMRSGLALR